MSSGPLMRVLTQPIEDLIRVDICFPRPTLGARLRQTAIWQTEGKVRSIYFRAKYEFCESKAQKEDLRIRPIIVDGRAPAACNSLGRPSPGLFVVATH